MWLPRLVQVFLCRCSRTHNLRLGWGLPEDEGVRDDNGSTWCPCRTNKDNLNYRVTKTHSNLGTLDMSQNQDGISIHFSSGNSSKPRDFLLNRLSETLILCHLHFQKVLSLPRLVQLFLCRCLREEMISARDDLDLGVDVLDLLDA